jgi:hypothetical protein
MALKPCRECGREISTEAPSCPHCGAPVATKPSAEEKNGAGCWGVGCASLVVVFVIFAAIGGGGDSGQPEVGEGPRWSGAWVVCEDFVRQRLRAPSTAEFPSAWSDNSRFVTDLGGGKFRVSAYVDAQNGFGAQIRNNFVCTVQWTGGSNYRLENLTID